MNTDTSIARAATCACEAVEVKLAGDPEIVSACNCTACQKRTGSVFGVSAFFSKEQILSVAGETKTYERLSEAGRAVSMHFCGKCGTTVYWELGMYPDHVGVAVGCFADREFPMPERAVWCSRMHPWVAFPASLKRYSESPA